MVLLYDDAGDGLLMPVTHSQETSASFLYNCLVQILILKHAFF